MLVAIGVLFLLGLALRSGAHHDHADSDPGAAAAVYKIDPHLLGLVVVMAVQTALISPPVALKPLHRRRRS